MARRKVTENINIDQNTPNWEELRTEWDKKVDEMQLKAQRVEVLRDIYEKVVSAMQWDCMEYHQADEEHEETWFTYDPDHYYAWKYPIYQEVLKNIADMANE